jgi:CheY-like chemotaxis protein
MTEVVSEYLDGGETNSTPTNATATQTEVAVEDKPIVIIADDSDLVSNFAANMLGDSYNIVTAKDGKEVLDIVNTAKYKIACLLLDLNMPNVGGFQVLDYFKENNLFAKIPVSIITGENGKESIDKVFGYGIVDMLEKPFSKDDIKRVVEKTIRNANI